MWKYKNKTIKVGRSFKDDDGVIHPPNWNIWSAEEKKAMQITEVVEETPPDSRLYTWSMNADGSINKKAKSLTDVNVVDDDGEAVLDSDGNQLVTLGIRSNLKNEIKRQQYALLSVTDWVVIRKADNGTAIPSNIQTYRNNIRSKATEMETAIDNAANVDAVADLFVSYDAGGNKSGILYDWPDDPNA
jgi:hypothetical protein